MHIESIREKLKSHEYGFLAENPHLGNNIILLCVGGSHAYGLNTETSDIDIRGCALNQKSEILYTDNFEQFVETETDTIIYSFNKLISLLCNCNPNTIELLGLRQEHYLYLHPIGRELLNKRKLFLSKRAINSFSGYANDQLRRLENISVRHVSQERTEEHILHSIQNAMNSYASRYSSVPEDSIKLYTDKAINPNFDSEIFMDINLSHYPLRGYKDMWSEMNSIVKSYNKLGKRNSYAREHNKLGKHMAHLIRLYMMCIDILEKEEIITYRNDEHDLLMDIRFGKYLTSDSQPIPEFYDILHDYECRLETAKKNTNLPKNPDYVAIKEFVMDVNERIVKGEI